MHATRILLTVALLVLAASVQAQSRSMSPEEQQVASDLVQAANQDRAGQGLPALREDPALTQAAWVHAQRMVASGTLSHQLPGEPNLIARVQQAGVHPSTVAENVASGPTANRINDEWMHSASHRGNLLDPRVDTIGVAVIRANGTDYAVQDFAKEVASMNREQQESRVRRQISSKGIAVSSSDAAARAYCHGTPANPNPLPRLVMHYSTTDLSRLPQQVEQGIYSGKFKRAVVAACAPADSNGFSADQIVILLY